MQKVLLTTITILLISHQIQDGIAFDIFDAPSTIIGIGQFFINIYQKLQPENIVFDETLIAINELSNNVLEDTKRILDNIKNLRSAIRHEFKEETLEQHFAYIAHVFEEAFVKKARVDSDRIYRNNSEYKLFAGKGKDLDRSIAEITRMLTDKKVGFALSQGFMSNLKKFEDTCRTGKSDLQLLDNLLTNIRFATAQYYWTRKLMYDFLELDREDNTYTKEDLLKDVSNHYARVAGVFQDAMTNASTEVWKCDPENGYDDSNRFINNSDSNFGEIRAFSKYIASEQNLAGGGGICSRNSKYQCPSLKKVDNCFHWDELCLKSRRCPGKLIGCETVTNAFRQNDKQIPYRYHTVAPTTSPFHCHKGHTLTLISSKSSAPDGTFKDYCHFCDCVCENTFEQNRVVHGFFIDTEPVQSDIESNKIITGARLIVEAFSDESREGQVLRIQIEESILLGNGTLTEKRWKTPAPITDHRYLRMISWELRRRFYLSPMIADEDEVITGLLFDLRSAAGDVEIEADKDIVLNIISNKINFFTGKLNTTTPSKTYYNKKPLTKSFDVLNANVPTRARHENNLLSSNDQYVDLTVTSLEEDGGQSTVPFIDFQKWSANMPLSGASLYVRGQTGYGGFLAIKLHTFNTRKYINTDTVLYPEGQYSALISNFHRNSQSGN